MPSVVAIDIMRAVLPLRRHHEQPHPVVRRSINSAIRYMPAASRPCGDSGDGQRLIRTVSRKGIRFVGGVEHNPQAVAGGKAAAQATTNITAASAERTFAMPDRPSIAVLPFQNM